MNESEKVQLELLSEEVERNNAILLKRYERVRGLVISEYWVVLKEIVYELIDKWQGEISALDIANDKFKEEYMKLQGWIRGTYFLITYIEGIIEDAEKVIESQNKGSK